MSRPLTSRFGLIIGQLSGSRALSLTSTAIQPLPQVLNRLPAAQFSPPPQRRPYDENPPLRSNPFAAEVAHRANYGYSGPGNYKFSPEFIDNLSIRNEPREDSAYKDSVRSTDATVTILRDVGNGWFEIAPSNRTGNLQYDYAGGFICMRCSGGISDLIPGTMFVRQDVGRVALQNVFATGPLTRARTAGFGLTVGQLPSSRLLRLAPRNAGLTLTPPLQDIGFPIQPSPYFQQVPAAVPAPPVLAAPPARLPIRQQGTIRRPVNLFRPLVLASDATISPGYQGRGTYRIVASQGLNLRTAPNSSAQSHGVILSGTLVEVLADNSDGWVQATVNMDYRRQGLGFIPVTGYLCMSCAQAPGGPWLVPARAGMNIAGGARG